MRADLLDEQSYDQAPHVPAAAGPAYAGMQQT